jgi:signal transduction histidine kinase
VSQVAGKAKQYVDQSLTSVQTTVNTLQQALNSAEKPDNKNKIQQAIDLLGSAQQELSGYQD